MSGWIKTYRSLADHWLADQPEKLGWWVLLLLKVAHEDKKILVGNKLVELKRGQIIISYEQLGMLWKTSKKSAERFVALLEQEQMLTRCVTHKISVLTICNYESYQDRKQVKCPDADPMLTRKVPTYKEDKEDKEIIDINNAHTREQKVSFDSQREQRFLDTFKGTGVALSMATATGKSGREILQLLDIFMAECSIRESGHKDFQDFKEHFLNAIKGDYISLPAQPQQQTKKIMSNEDFFKEMYR